jgi:transmembrane sensor
VSERRLSGYVQPQLSEARVARQWSEADRRSQGPRGLRRPLQVVLAVGAVLAAVLLVLHARPRAAGSLEGALLEGGEVKLPDGSQIAVDPGAQVRIAAVRADRVELGLVAGALSLSVPHASRRLLVHAGAYDVVDLGTRFRVALGAGGDVSVEVAEGSVSIESRTGGAPPFALGAGGKWSSGPAVAAATLAPSAEAVPGPVVDADAVPAEAVPPDAVPGPAADATPGPRELLETAERARLGGHPRAAAAALDTLRRRYRRDPRAALAAFELGRLRLDSLRDAPGAVEALTDAIALAPKGTLREDAEARRVEALAAERSPDCAAARDAFLARYPQGVHRALVAGQCSAD